MSIYIVSERHFFREIGSTREPGTEVELDEAIADAYNKSHPGLLTEKRITTQASPTVTREAPTARRRKG